ncbi:MAG: metalloregulator ArsR/SmtB family transcription factor [Rhodovibrionaceae bacterium]|nr:metalloregulator ArsR/SmtB family transcription factor [Rhodovibrionaceae bacterium]
MSTRSQSAQRSGFSQEEAARCLETLGHATRLEIFRLLVRAGHPGLPVGQIQEHLGIPASTLSHHVAQLVQTGLVVQEREGRSLICKPDFEQMDRVIAYLTDECCVLAEAPSGTSA